MPKPKQSVPPTLDNYDIQCLKLGRYMLRRVRDVLSLPPNQYAYSSQQLTFKTGSAHVLVVREDELLAIIDEAVREALNVTVTRAPTSTEGTDGTQSHPEGGDPQTESTDKSDPTVH